MLACRSGLAAFLAILPCWLVAEPPATPLSSAPAHAASPKAAPAASASVQASPDARGLVDKLGSAKHEERAQASDGLEKLGPTALPVLRDALDKPTDPEVRRRLEEVIARLETVGALKAARINLKAVDQPVRKIAEELGKQAGYKLEIWPPGGGDEREKRILSVDFKDATFWDSLQQLCDLGGLIMQEGWYGGDSKTIRLQFGDAAPGYYSHDGPFRIVARSLNYFRSLNLGQARNSNSQDQSRTESLNISLHICVEPRLPLYGVGQPNIVEAIDNLDQSLKLPNQNQQNTYRSYYSGYQGFMQQVNLSLNPMANSRRIKSLKGTIPVTLIALQRPKLTVDLTEFGKQEGKAEGQGKAESKEKKPEGEGKDKKPAPAPAAKPEASAEFKPKNYKAGNTTLIIEEATRSGNQITLKLSLTESSKNGQQDYAWVNTVIQRLEVLDDKGVKMQSFSQSWGMNGQSVSGTFTYGPSGGGAGAPAKLIYYDWITLSHEVPFAFQDLPLP